MNIDPSNVNNCHSRLDIHIQMAINDYRWKSTVDRFGHKWTVGLSDGVSGELCHFFFDLFVFESDYFSILKLNFAQGT